MTDFGSICSGGEWWAAYNIESGPWFKRIVVFMSRPDPDDPRYPIVDAIDETDLADNDGSTVLGYGNFAGLFHSTDFDVLGEKLNPKAQARLNRGE
ncbi:MAG: hypothetical protein ACP5DX_13905 [Paracoccaceae bacterium]